LCSKSLLKNVSGGTRSPPEPPIASTAIAQARPGTVAWPTWTQVERLLAALVSPSTSKYQWIGLGEHLQENPIFNGKNNGFL